MFRRLVLEGFRTRRWQAAGCVASCSLASAALQCCIGIHHGIGPSPSLQRLMIGLWTSGLLACVAGIAFFVLLLVQYAEVRERTHDYGVLRVLGASGRYFSTLLAWEAVLIAVPGTICGIVLTSAAEAAVALLFPRYLALSVSRWSWPAGFLFSFCVLMAGGALGARTAIGDGLEEALSYQK